MSNFAKDQCRSVGEHLTTTSDTTIFTAGQYTYCIGIRCVNITSSAATVSVSWTSTADSDTYKLVHEQSIPGNLYAYYPLEGVVLAQGDTLKVQAGTSNAIDVTLTVVEWPGRSG